MTSSRRLLVEPLADDEAEALLARNHVGRLAFSLQDQVDIRPLGYVFRDGWLFGRTEPGGKLDTLARNRWVAFQVDEVKEPWDWSSVVVRGAFHVLSPDAPGEEARVRERAEEVLRGVFEDLFGPDDPGAHRTVLFAIAPQEISGRRARLAEDEPVD